jgi:hypothetical protein
MIPLTFFSEILVYYEALEVKFILLATRVFISRQFVILRNIALHS